MNATQIKLSTMSGMVVTLSPKYDARISVVAEGTVYTRSAKAAAELKSEIAAWGVRDFVDIRWIGRT